MFISLLFIDKIIILCFHFKQFILLNNHVNNKNLKIEMNLI